MRSFVKKNPREMEKSFCRLLILVNHALVANFKRCKYVLNAIRENKILAKTSGFAVFNVGRAYYCQLISI